MIEEDNQWQNMSNYERLKMIKQNWLFLKYFKNQTEDECVTAVKQSSNALQYVHHQTHKICLEAIKVNPLAISMVINKTVPLCLEAVKLNPAALQYVPSSLQTLEICEKALTIDGMCLKYVINQTERLCYESLISSKGASLNLIKNQTKFLCREAMKLDGTLLIYVNEQTFEICLEAVKQSPSAIRYVKYNALSENDIEIVVYEAIKRDGNVIQYIDKRYHTQKVCIMALQANKGNIRYIDLEKFNISLIDFEAHNTNSLITINQEYYYIIKTNMLRDCIRNVKLDNKIFGLDTFEWYAKECVEKIKKKMLCNNEKTTNPLPTVPTKENTNSEELIKGEAVTPSLQESEDSNEESPEVDIILKRITANKYEIYKVTTFTKYKYFFYKYREEQEEHLYTLELFKYTTGLIL